MKLREMREQRQSPALSKDSKAPKEGAIHPHGCWHGDPAAGWHRRGHQPALAAGSSHSPAHVPQPGGLLWLRAPGGCHHGRVGEALHADTTSTVPQGVRPRAQPAARLALAPPEPLAALTSTCSRACCGKESLRTTGTGMSRARPCLLTPGADLASLPLLWQSQAHPGAIPQIQHLLTASQTLSSVRIKGQKYLFPFHV